MNEITSILDLVKEPENPSHKKISYSQFSSYSTCPNRWKLSYIDKHKLGKPSIHLIFGTAMHETLQTYLKVMYDDSVKAADNLGLNTILSDSMVKEFKKVQEKNPGIEFTSKKEMSEFYSDGVAILDWFEKRRGGYFSKKGYELMGIELPLYTPATPNNKNIMMYSLLDVVLRDTINNKVIIYDFKTSTRGWKKEKKDKNKVGQLILYKHYFSEQYNIDPDSVDIEFLILKRKLIQDFAYPQKRIQSFIPPSGKVTRRKLLNEIEVFIQKCFNADGSYNTMTNYPAVSGIEKGNCKYCEFNNREDLCPTSNRVTYAK